MKHLLLLTILIAGVLLFGACGDDDPTEPPGGESALYWAELPTDCSSTTIFAADPNSVDADNIVTLGGPRVVVDLAVDSAVPGVFFTFATGTGSGEDLVQAVDKDGGNLRTLADYAADAQATRGLALDTAASRLYWLAAGGCEGCPGCGPCTQIHSATTEGTDVDTVLTLDGPNDVSALAVDPAGDKLYWADASHAPHVQRSNLDGTSIEPVYTVQDSPGGVRDLEVAGGRLYWLQTSGINDAATIRSAELDGTGPEVLVILGEAQASTPQAIAVDPVAGKLYWTEGDLCGNPVTGKIMQARLDGLGIEPLIEQIGHLIALEVVR